MKADSKIGTLDELALLRKSWAAQGKTVVWTNGCFDLLHAGHVRSLRDAKALGDILVVGINSDASVRTIKGNARPIVAQDDRAELIAALEPVDYVTIFDEPDPIMALRRLRPDVHCKGADYASGLRPLPERDDGIELRRPDQISAAASGPLNLRSDRTHCARWQGEACAH